MLAFLLRLFWNWRPLKINWIFNNPIAVSHNVMKIFLGLSNNYWFSNFVFHKIFDVLFYSKNHFMSKRIKQIFFKNHSFPWAIFQYFYYDLLCNSENPLWLIHLLNISENMINKDFPFSKMQLIISNLTNLVLLIHFQVTTEW